jgi:uncharacterized protein YbjT (DUF2867 family)
MSAKVIAVLGATGAQGGAVCRAALSDSATGFKVRAVTRDPTKEKAKALESQGAEVVQADIDDVESLKQAFAGAFGVFALTNFWEHMSAEKETQQAENIAKAAAAAGVKHVVWSTLEDTRQLMDAADTRMPMLQGKYRVPHFDGKADADKAFAGVPTTFLLTSFYWDNLYIFGMAPKKNEQGEYSWTFPMGNAKLAGAYVEDLGKAAYGVFKAGDKYVGKRVGVMTSALTIDEMCGVLSKQYDVKVTYNPVEPDVYRSFGFPGADELGNMFQCYRDFEGSVLGARSEEVMRELNPEALTFEQFVAQKSDAIKASMDS